MTNGEVVEQIWEVIATTVAEFEERRVRPTGAAVKSRAQVTLGHKIVESDFGYPNFKQLVIAAADAGYIALRDLPKDTDMTLATVDYEFVLLAKVVRHMIERGVTPLGAHTKPLLTDALGGAFDQTALGYKSFKDFCLAAQERGFVNLVDDSERSDFQLALPSHSANTELNPPTPTPTPTPKPKPGPPPGSPLTPTLAALHEEPPLLLDEAFELLREVVVQRHRDGKGVSAAQANDLLRRATSRFSISSLKYARFGEFLHDAEQAGYVILKERPGHGKSVVDLFAPAPEGVAFADLLFGFASAGAESVQKPALLREGFYDFNDVTRSLVEGSEYVVLGHKGSGKSAIGEHLVQRSEQDPTLFVDLIDLKDFPYGTLSQLAADDSSQQILRLSWRWLILVRVFQLMLTDEGADPMDVDESQKLARALAKQGLIPSKSLTELSLRSVSVALKGGFSSLAGGAIDAEFSTRQVQLTDAVGRLEAIVSHFRTDSRHLHVIDGLDELLTPDDRQYASLSALLGEVESLNDIFFRDGSSAKVVLLCRSDLYERLSSPNKNKIRQNFAVSLRWSAQRFNEDQATLSDLLLHRARLSGYVGDDPIRDLLPLKASVGKYATDMWTFLVDQTRHTPRDLIALLTKIQRKAARSAVTTSHIQRALNDYSTDYFVPELKDELQGYLRPDHVDDLFGLLSALRRRSFRLSSLEKLATARGLDLPVLEAVQILFECSAVGHDRSDEDSKNHEFRYLYPNLSVDPEARLLVHRGAWWALNLAN